MPSKTPPSTTTAETDVVAENAPHKIKCGLIMPISKSQGLEPEHWLNVKGIICEALADTEFDVRLVSESDDVGVIHKSIVQNIYKNDIVICDVSTHNANVMFELGLRLAFDKPTVIIKDDETPFSFDTQVIEHIVYKRSLHYVDIVSFKKKLKEKVVATIKQSQEPGFSTFLGHFTINHVSTIEERTVSINDALFEKIEQIQKTIRTISRQQDKNTLTQNAIFEGNNDSTTYNTVREWAVNLHVDKFLNSMAQRMNISNNKLAVYLSNLTTKGVHELVNEFNQQCVMSGFAGAPFPTDIIKKEMSEFISEYI